MKIKNILLIFSLSLAFATLANFKGKTEKRFKKYHKQKTELNISKKQKKKVIKFAESYIGTKYKFAGLNRNGIDCSGLIHLAFKQIDIKLPKMADAIAYNGKAVWKIDDLKMGDLIFFEKTYNSQNTITHVGIYIKDGKFIHASSSLGVNYSNINSNNYWKNKFAFGKRL